MVSSPMAIIKMKNRTEERKIKAHFMCNAIMQIGAHRDRVETCKSAEDSGKTWWGGQSDLNEALKEWKGAGKCLK